MRVGFSLMPRTRLQRLDLGRLDGLVHLRVGAHAPGACLLAFFG